jgi:hypothetical protein
MSIIATPTQPVVVPATAAKSFDKLIMHDIRVRLEAGRYNAIALGYLARSRSHEELASERAIPLEDVAQLLVENPDLANERHGNELRAEIHDIFSQASTDSQLASVVIGLVQLCEREIRIQTGV